MIGLKSTQAISNQFIYQSKSSSRQGHIRRLGFFLSVLKQKFNKFYLLYTINLHVYYRKPVARFGIQAVCEVQQYQEMQHPSHPCLAKIVPIIT